MKFIQLSIFIGHNRPGALNDACQLLADARIDLSTLTLADTKEFGILRLITKDWEKAKALLSEAGFMVQTTEVVALLVDHRPGGMCGILDTLAKNNINVEYLYAFATPIAGNAVVVFRFDNPDDAIAKLTEKGNESIRMVSPGKIFGTEHE